MHPAIQEFTTNSSIERLRTLLASVDLDQLTSTVEPMMMDTERGRTWTALFNAEVEEMQDNTAARDATSSPVASAPVAAAGSAPTEPEESMEVEEEASSAVPRRSRLERLRQEAARKESDVEPVIDVVMGSQSWHNEVPRVKSIVYFQVVIRLFF